MTVAGRRGQWTYGPAEVVIMSTLSSHKLLVRCTFLSNRCCLTCCMARLKESNQFVGLLRNVSEGCSSQDSMYSLQ